MTKSDLKTGMLFQCRDGDVGIVINGSFIFRDCWLNPENYNEDLTSICRFRKENDIVKLSIPLQDNNLIPKYWNKELLNSLLLWERGEKSVIKVVAEIDGKEVPLHKVSKETLLEIRELSKN